MNKNLIQTIKLRQGAACLYRHAGIISSTWEVEPGNQTDLNCKTLPQNNEK
jgi:hypothetical protein